MAFLRKLFGAREQQPASEQQPTSLDVPQEGKQLPRSFISQKDGKEMILIPAGEFVMGSDRGAGNEKPQHKIYLPDFYISRYPVTNAEFEAFVKATGHVTAAEKKPEGRLTLGRVSRMTFGDVSKVLGYDWRHPDGPDSSIVGKEKHPVVQVRWDDALAYCEWVGKRLPKEAEWEKAARGTDGRTWPWGNEWVDGRCNTSEAGVGHTTPVGRYSPGGDSPYGVGDMAGNVWEWTADWYKAYPGSTYTSDLFGRTSRVLRGGSWILNQDFARCAYRIWDEPVLWNIVGFRVAVSPAEADS